MTKNLIIVQIVIGLLYANMLWQFDQARCFKPTPPLVYMVIGQIWPVHLITIGVMSSIGFKVKGACVY